MIFVVLLALSCAAYAQTTIIGEPHSQSSAEVLCVKGDVFELLKLQLTRVEQCALCLAAWETVSDIEHGDDVITADKTCRGICSSVKGSAFRNQVRFAKTAIQVQGNS